MVWLAGDFPVLVRNLCHCANRLCQSPAVEASGLGVLSFIFLCMGVASACHMFAVSTEEKRG